MDKGERKQVIPSSYQQYPSFNSGSSSGSGSSSESDDPQANMYRTHTQHAQPRSSAPQPMPQQAMPYQGMPMYQPPPPQPSQQRPRPVVPAGGMPQPASGRSRHSAPPAPAPGGTLSYSSGGSDGEGSSSASGSYSGSENSISDGPGMMQQLPPPPPVAHRHQRAHHSSSRHSQHSHHHHRSHAPPMMPGMGMMTGMGMVPGAGLLPGPQFAMQYPAQYQQMLQMQAQHARKAEKRKRKHRKHKKKKDKNAPKRAQSAYIFFGKEIQEQVRMELRKTNPDVKQKDVLFAIAERWKTMLPTERQPFEEKAKRDKERYAAEMAAYKPPSSSSSSSSSSESSSSSGHKKPKRKKHKKDPSAPKRAKTGYMLFTDENRDRVRSELKTRPNFKNQDVLTELGRLWKALPEEEKKNYNERVMGDRERYQKEITEYRKKQGPPTPAPPQGINPSTTYAQYYGFGPPKIEEQPPHLPL